MYSAADRVAHSPQPRRARPRIKAAHSASRGLALVRDPLRVLLFLLTVVTISRVHLHYPVLAKLRPVLVLTVAAVGYACLYPRYLTKASVMRIWPMRHVVVLGILACCSAPFGISLGNSGLYILDSYVKTLIFSFLIALAIRRAEDLYTFVWAFVVSCGILSLFSIFVFQLESAGNQAARLAEMYTYDSNDVGVILMIGLPLTLLLLSVDRGAKRWLLASVVVGISIAMARAGSRGGFLGLVAVGLGGLILVNRVSAARRISVAALALVALSLAAPPGYWKQMSTIMSPKEDYNYSSLDGRNQLIKRGLGYMAEYPVFGIGIYNFAKAECTISPKIQWRPANEPVRCVAPHNSLLQAGTELGIPGLLVWVSLLFGSIVAPLRLRRRLPRAWRTGTPIQCFLYASATFLPIAMIGFAVTSFFVSFAFSDPLYVMAAFITGLYVAVATQLRAEGAEGAGSAEPIPPVGRESGWRVKRSTRRFSMLSPSAQGGQ